MNRSIVNRSSSARALIDEAKDALGVRSRYALALQVGLPPKYLYRYYSDNKMSLAARALLSVCIDAARSRS